MATSRMPIEKFLPAYLKAHAEGLSKEEFARRMGLKPSTVYQRVYELRREGHDVPLLACEGRESKFDKAAKILAAHSGGKAAAPPKKKTEAKPAKVKEAVKEVAKEPVLEEEESDDLADIFSSDE